MRNKNVPLDRLGIGSPVGVLQRQARSSRATAPTADVLSLVSFFSLRNSSASRPRPRARPEVQQRAALVGQTGIGIVRDNSFENKKEKKNNNPCRPVTLHSGLSPSGPRVDNAGQTNETFRGRGAKHLEEGTARVPLKPIDSTR